MKTATEKGTQTSLDKRLLKVLLVEDEATDKISVERILRTCSSPVEFVVESVVSLSEAIGNLAEKKYDAILLDLELPDSSGIETLRQTVKVAPDIPVVVLTEVNDEQTGFSALEDGATDYLVKDLPLDLVLVRTIIYALQRKKIQMHSLKLTHDINERMKELNCLYGISKLVETPGISLEEILEKIVCLIPAGCQHPGIARARIIFEGKEYKTGNFKPSKWIQSADITLKGQKVGTVEFCYMKERPPFDEGPFPEEKRDLIDAIGERLGKIAERIKAEKALRESRATFNLVLNTVPQSIFWKDLEGRYLGCNRVFADAVGLDDTARIVGKTDFDLPWPREEAEAYRTDDRDVLENNRPKLHIIEQLQQADGHRLWIDTSKMPLCDAHGRPFAVLGVYDDITRRKQAEEALRESEERYKNLFMANVDGILISDAATKKFRYANPAICRMLGYSEEELTQMGVADIHPKESLEQVLAEFEAQTSGAKITAKDLQCIRKDGQVISVSINAGTVMIDQTKHLLGIFRDITERKQAEEQIRLASEEWEMTFNSITDLVFIQDKNFTIKKVNKTFAAAIKMNPKDIIGKKCYDILHNLDHPWPGCPLKKAKQDGASHTEEVNDPHIGIPLLVTASPIIDANGEIIGAVHIARDITERKNKEKLILDANLRLEKVSEELSAAKRDLEQKNDALQKVCSELQQRVKEQTAQLAAANKVLGVTH